MSYEHENAISYTLVIMWLAECYQCFEENKIICNYLLGVFMVMSSYKRYKGSHDCAFQ
jgi:hypothetical protein